MAERSVSRPIVIGFSIGVVLFVVLVTTLYDRSVEVAKRQAVLPEFPAPNFPVPALPGQVLQGASIAITQDGFQDGNHAGIEDGSEIHNG